MVSTDDVDRALIALLRTNARMPITELARKLRVARATVQNRLARLEQSGLIAGYTVKLAGAASEGGVRAVMGVAVLGHEVAEVARQLRLHPNVAALHRTNGRWEYVAELRAPDMGTLDAVLSQMRLIPGIVQTETSVLIRSWL
jgi:DNA-binding Lrp family transcriptional regulator